LDVEGEILIRDVTIEFLPETAENSMTCSHGCDYEDGRLLGCSAV
jgi:hypothetical protein